MRLKSVAVAVAIFAVASLAPAQAWKDSYDQALKALSASDWAAASTAFKASIAVRQEDQSSATILPGPVTEPVKWRNGSPYSPNFGVAYCSYKLALNSKDAERTEFLKQAATGFETLVAKGQVSYATLYFLNRTYGLQEQTEKQRDLEAKLSVAQSWNVDSGILTPEEAGMITASIPNATKGGNSNTKTDVSSPGGTGPKIVVVKPGSDPKQSTMSTIAGRVPIIDSKFALIIGNSQSQMPSGALDFAASDSLVVQDALIQNAGYDEKNVDVITDATADQMMKAATALSQRLPMNATVLIYYSGIGVNIDGKDYLVGVDAALSPDTSKMVPLDSLLKIYRSKGAKVFLFCQTNRPIKDGRYFGQGKLEVGMLSIAHATSPDGVANDTMSNNKKVGLYTKAFTEILATYRSNQVPIYEFSWAVFSAIQGSNTDGGGTFQVPSLPRLQYIGKNTPF